MSSSDWIALAAVAVAVLNPVLTSLTAGARRDGKIDQAIKTLTEIAADHEARLRRGRL